MKRTAWKPPELLIRCAIAVSLMFLAGNALPAQLKLRIIEPAANSVVAPGQAVTVVVEALPAGSLPDIMLVGEDPLPSTLGVSRPPYRFSIVIPRDISSRRYGITARGAVLPGQIVFSDPFTVDVERPGMPIKLKADPANLFFSYVGDETRLRLDGTFAGEEDVSLEESTYVHCSSDNPSVAAVGRFTFVKATGKGKANITVTYRGKSVVVPVTVR